MFKEVSKVLFFWGLAINWSGFEGGGRTGDKQRMGEISIH